MEICVNAFFPRFQLTMHVFVFSFCRLCCQLLTLLRRNLVPDVLIAMHPIRNLRNIEQHCTSSAFLVLRYDIAKYVLWCLNKKRYDRFPIYLIAYSILPIFPVISLHSIRDHNFVYIDRKYIS